MDGASGKNGNISFGIASESTFLINKNNYLKMGDYLYAYAWECSQTNK